MKTVPCLGSHQAACAGIWHVYWWRDATSGSCVPGGERHLVTFYGLFTERLHCSASQSLEVGMPGLFFFRHI